MSARTTWPRETVLPKETMELGETVVLMGGDLGLETGLCDKE